MALADIRARIVANLQSVDGIGPVYGYERMPRDWKRFLDLFKTGHGKINGWMATRRKTPAQWAGFPTVERNHLWVMRGVYGLNDEEASELAFQAQIEAIQAVFENDGELGGTVLRSEPVQVATVEHRMFANVLCHWAELHLPAVERVMYS